MSNVETAFSHTVKKLTRLMLMVVAIAAILGFILKGTEFGLAVLYGGAITVAGALFFAWRLRAATVDTAAPHTDLAANAGVKAGILFQGIILRLILTIALLALGMGVLKLDPLGMVIGFALPMTAYWFSGTAYGKTRRK